MNILPNTRRQYITAAIATLIAITLGSSAAAIVANEQHGYVAGYTFFVLFMFGLFLISALLLASIAFFIRHQTRWVSIVLVMSAMLIPVSYFSSFIALKRSGRVRYESEAMRPIVPEVADLVIYFKSEATHDQIESFWQEILSTREEKGHRHRPGIGSMVRRAPVQSHEVIVVSFFPNATAAQREDVKSRVKLSPIVYRIKENLPTSQTEQLE